MPSQTYVIVGAAGGIGTDLCQRLAARGPCNLVVAGRDAAKLARLASELPAAVVVARALDATDSGAVEALFAEASALGSVTGAANLCGSILLKPAHLTSDKEFADTVATNLVTAFNVLRSAAKAMTQSGGSIALVSTVATKIGLANHEAIAAAKGGINGLVLSAAATYANRGIRVNAVAPGLVRTPLSERLTGSEATLKASTAMHPLGRIGEPADVGTALAWLLDPATTWVTGQVLSVDGGLSCVRAR